MTSTLPTVSPVRAGLRVACLCADWCHVCSGWRDEFEATLRAAGVAAHWIDIEDEEELLGPIEVDDFPTLLVVRDGQPVWFGVIAPRAAALQARLEAAAAAAALEDAALRALAARL